jgi:O-succinylbenzoate synthase
MLETGIGRAYNVALASLPHFTLPGDLSPSARYWEQDIVKQPWTMDADGTVEVPLDRNGTGVEVNEELVDELTVRRLTLGPR